jgi:type IV pilus assembly protein PilB
MPDSSSRNDQHNIADILLDSKLITQDQYNLILGESERKGMTVGEVVKERNFVSEDELARAYGRLLNIPFVDLRQKSIPRDVLFEIPQKTMINYQFIPFEKSENVLRVAMVDPENFQAIEALSFLTESKGLDTEAFITTRQSFETALRQHESFREEIGKALQEVSEFAEEEIPDEDVGESQELGRIVQNAPITKAISIVIKYAVKQKASDIHIEPKGKNVRVRYRIDGILQTRILLPLKLRASLVSRIKVLSNLRLDEQRVPQDGRFHLQIEGHDIDFRVSTYPTVNGEKTVLRILDKSASIQTLEALGLEGQRLDDVRDIANQLQGMFLMTGPTGSGKSTTLYTVLNSVNKVGVNIVTLEDPVEYFIEGVNQAQINPDAGFTFASGLRSILRQDPDVIFVGEIRDSETVQMAVHSALTGHSVLTTLHTNNAAGAIPRLIDMGVEPFLIISSINLVAAQRLVRRICKDCKTEVPNIPDELKQTILVALANVKEREKFIKNDEVHLYRGAGCERCNDTGYKGRVGIFETIPMSTKLEHIILTNPSTNAIAKVARDMGRITMYEDGLLKVLQGTTTYEELIRATKVDVEEEVI